MRRVSMGCGSAVLCMLTMIAVSARAQTVRKDTGQDAATSDSVADTVRSTDAEPSAPPSESEEPSDKKTAPSDVAGAEDTSSSSESAVDSESAGESVPAEAPLESAVDSESAAFKDTSPASERPVVDTGVSKEPEHIPEAIEVDNSARPLPRVGIQPAGGAPQAASSGGRRNVLVGTWTKSILFSTKDGSFKFQPRGWVQPKFVLCVNSDNQHNDDEPLMGTGFAFQRARFGFRAWLFNWGHIYFDSGWKNSSPRPIEYSVDIGPNNGDGAVGVRVGLFRPFLARQILHATTRTTMIDYARAWTALDFVPESDGTLTGFDYTAVALNKPQLGIAVQGFSLNGLEYGIGIWNGADTYDMDADFIYGGRIAIHPTALAGGSALRPGDESDTDISPSPALSIGLAAYIEDRDDATADLPGLLPYDDYKLRAGLDVAFKYAGASLSAEFFFVKAWAMQEIVNDYLKLYRRDAPGMGAYAQAAYMVVPKRVEIAGRFDMADENIEIRGIRFYPTVGVTYFVFGHNLKAQFQYRVNVGAGYEEVDPMYTPVTHDVIFMLQASI